MEKRDKNEMAWPKVNWVLVMQTTIITATKSGSDAEVSRVPSRRYRRERGDARSDLVSSANSPSSSPLVPFLASEEEGAQSNRRRIRVPSILVAI